MNSIYRDGFYHKSITLLPIPSHFPLFKNDISRCPDLKSLFLRTGCSFDQCICIEKLDYLESVSVDKFFGHTGFENNRRGVRCFIR